MWYFQRKAKVRNNSAKLVVFRCMGQNAPRKFTCKEDLILMGGMLPEIPLDAIEVEVREEILSVLRTNVELDLENCSEFDFEFINLCGKNACIPTLKSETTFNCKTLKKLAGNGSVYIRMKKEFEGGGCGDSDERQRRLAALQVQKIYPPSCNFWIKKAISHCRSYPSTSHHPPHPSVSLHQTHPSISSHWPQYHQPHPSVSHHQPHPSTSNTPQSATTSHIPQSAATCHIY